MTTETEESPAGTITTKTELPTKVVNANILERELKELVGSTNFRIEVSKLMHELKVV